MSDKILFTNCKIGYRNFKGEQTKYNRSGDRNFVIFLDPDLAEELARDGFNIKYPKTRDDISEEDDLRLPFLKVVVKYGVSQPTAVLINGATKSAQRLTEDTIDVLDDIDIEECDIEINPYHWKTPDKEGISAYLSKIYVTQKADYFSNKYGI